MQAGTLSADDLAAAEEAMKQINDAWEWLGAMQRNGGAVSAEAVSSTRVLRNQVQRALEQVRAQARRNETPTTADTTATGTPTNPTGGRGTGMSSGATGGGGASMKTVDIRINGRSTPVGVNSDADAEALVGALRALETDLNRA